MPALLARALALGLARLPEAAELDSAPLVALVPPPFVVELLLMPPQGATVGEVVVPPLGVMVTPATLQFRGICCSMISTKLSCVPPLLMPVVVVLVELPLLAPVEAPLAAAEEPAGAPLGAVEAPVAAPLAAADAGVAVVVVVVPETGLAARISRKTTVWPLLARFRKVPAMAGVPLDEPLLVEVLPVDEAPLAPEPLLVAKEPLHWFWLSICW